MEVQSGVDSRDRAIYANNIEISDIHEQQEQPLLSQDPVMVDLYSPTTPSRMSKFRQSLTKRHLEKAIYKWRWPILIIVSSFFMGLFMWVYRKEVFQGLETLSNKLKDMGYRLVSTKAQQHETQKKITLILLVAMYSCLHLYF